MNTIEILCAIQGDSLLRTYCAGVVPCDRLPLKEQLTFPCYIISNTDPHNKPGKHWILMFFTAPGCCTYFDSYGREPLGQFRSYLGNTAVTVNNTQVQAYHSAECGAHCLFVAYYMVRGHTFHSVVSRYSENYNKNDEGVGRFVRSSLIGREGGVARLASSSLIGQDGAAVCNQLCTSL
jgi:hypothetical protein